MFSEKGDCDSERRPDIPSECSDEAASNRKLAFQNLLKRYYHQVTRGCGNAKCKNKSCAQNRPVPVGHDEGAAIALQLVRERAKLCVRELPKLPVQEGVLCLTEEKINNTITSCQEENNFKSLVGLLGDVFTNSSLLNNSFPAKPDTDECVDLESVRNVYETLFDLENSAVENTLINSLGTLSTDIEVELKRKASEVDITTYFKQFLIIFENPYLNQPVYMENALPCFCKAMTLLPLNIQVPLIREWSKQSRDSLRKKTETIQNLITHRVIRAPPSTTVNEDPVIANATKCLKLFHYASLLGGKFDRFCSTDEPMDTGEPSEEDTLAKRLELDVLDCREPVLPFDEFINEPLNEEIAVDRDFTLYKTKRGFSFIECNFILTTRVKSVWMFYDNRVNMLQERRLTHLFSLLRGQQPSPYLKLTVHRDNLIQDALVNLEMIYQDNPQALKKQLFVEFDGEQGLDEGGVSKEFFQLVVEQIFNPDYGMFTYDTDTRQCWFNQTSFESRDQFTLIGLILGLAIYNNIILDVHFPMVVYRKLFGRSGSLVDLRDSHPVIANSLQNILDFEGDVENTFLCTFAISYADVFGNVLTHELIENGKDIPVTNENRKKYVDFYVDYILNKSIEDQFRPFKQGFDMVTKESPLRQLFRPEEVELLVCGSKDFDFEALERTTEYEGGFTEMSPIIRWFWDVVHQFSIEQKKQLLMFITGSDRVPIGGLATLKLVIARQGPNSNSLPTAHTCFNVLLIPDYSKKSQLEERLVKAITYSKGFGLI